MRAKTDTYSLPFENYPTGGMIMPKRSFNSDDYRNGFGSNEKIDEITGVGNVVDMGDRWLDTRLIRTPKIDAKHFKYPALSPYSYVANNPINAIDPDGKDIYFVNRNPSIKQDPKLIKENYLSIMNTLNSTELGSSIVNEYLNNPNKDLYISFGDIAKGNVGELYTGATITYEKNIQANNLPSGNEDLVSNDYIAIGSNTYFSSKEQPSNSGVIIDTKKENSFIVLNKNLYTGNINTLTVKEGAETAGHEIKAHASNGPNIDAHKGHTLFGGVGIGGHVTGLAKELRTQLTNLLNTETKKDLKLGQQKQDGVYKTVKE